MTTSLYPNSNRARATATTVLCVISVLLGIAFVLSRPHPVWMQLEDALVNDDFERISSLLHEGAAVDTRCRDGSNIDEYWRLPIHVAAENGNARVISLLLDAGADPNAADSHDYTPIMAVVNADRRPGHRNCITILLERGANINAQRRRNGATALDLAVDYGDTKMVHFLLECGADPTIKGELKEGDKPD